jgi:hypothetical protein
MAFIMDANEEFQEFKVSLPQGKTKTYRKWKNPKTSKQRKDNEAYESALKVHQRNTGQESVEGVPRIARSNRSAFEQAKKEIRDRSDLNEEQRRQHLIELSKQQAEVTNASEPKDDPELTSKQRHRRRQRERQRLKRKSLREGF